MAFTYHDTTTDKATYDLACPDVVARKLDGTPVLVIKDGAINTGAKTQIAALTNITSAAPADLPAVISDIALIKQKINAIHAALKA